MARTRSNSAPGADAEKDPAPRRPPLRAAQREFTRRILIDAAVEVFERDGYSKATVDDIVKAANATRPTFYQYFSGKREIAAALQEEIWTVGIGIFDRAHNSGELTPAAIRDWVAGVADFYDTYRSILRAVLAAAREDPAIAERIAGSHQRFVALLAPRLADDPTCSREVRALLLEAQRTMIMEWLVLEQWPVDRESLLDELARIWASALGVS